MVHTVLSKDRTVSTILLTALRVKLHKKVLRGTICAPNYAYLGENYPKVCSSSLSCQARSSVYVLERKNSKLLSAAIQMYFLGIIVSLTS